jgi:hypothetical protein
MLLTQRYSWYSTKVSVKQQSFNQSNVLHIKLLNGRVIKNIKIKPANNEKYIIKKLLTSFVHSIFRLNKSRAWHWLWLFAVLKLTDLRFVVMEIWPITTSIKLFGIQIKKMWPQKQGPGFEMLIHVKQHFGFVCLLISRPVANILMHIKDGKWGVTNLLTRPMVINLDVFNLWF